MPPGARVFLLAQDERGRDQGAFASADARSIPVGLVVPNGTYRPYVRLGDAGLRFPPFDALGGEIEVELVLPSVRTLEGRVVGRLLGPLPDVGIAVRKDRFDVRGRARTDREGRFAVEFLGDERLELVANISDWGVQFPPLVHAVPDDGGTLELVRPEERLRAELNPPDALAGRSVLRVHAFDIETGEESSDSLTRTRLGEEPWEVLLPPGWVVVSRQLGAERVEERASSCTTERRSGCASRRRRRPSWTCV
jgi:hypothetical protein